MGPTNHDVVIVGGGAAGLSAALVLGRARRRVAVIDAGMPRNAPAARMHGYLSRDGMVPSELLAVGREEVATYGVEIVHGTVEAAAVRGSGRGDRMFELRSSDGRELLARRVLVTSGAFDEIPDIAGLRDRWGRDVLHCPYCHGWEVRDRRLGVLGSIQGSVDHALLVRQWSDDVVFVADRYQLTETDRARLRARDVGIVEGPVARLVVDADRLRGVELASGATVSLDAVFVRPAIRPHPDGLLAGLGCRFDDGGFVVVDRSGATTVPGVWAAGNVADPRAQVITAAGQGSAAAIAINADLVEADVDAALAAGAAR